MLPLPASVRIHVATQPVDGRKGIDSLAALVRGSFGMDPLAGQMFAFFSRRRDRVRILYFDRGGFVLITKRLEQGSFVLPWDARTGPASRAIEWPQLALILEGIDLRDARVRRRWKPAA